MAVQEVLVAYDCRETDYVQLSVPDLLDERPHELGYQAVFVIGRNILPVLCHQVLLTQGLRLLKLGGSLHHQGEIAILKLVDGDQRLQELLSEHEEVGLYHGKRDVEPADHFENLIGNVVILSDFYDLALPVRRHHDIEPGQHVPVVLVLLFAVEGVYAL